MNTPTLPQFKKWASEHKPLAEAVCLAQAFAEMERARVDAYEIPLFLSFGFTDKTGKPLEIPEELYLCKDEAKCMEFYAASYKAHRAHGWKGREGHCPALTAEHLVIDAQNSLLKAGENLMGVEFTRSMKTRAKALELFMGACLVNESSTVREG